MWTPSWAYSLFLFDIYLTWFSWFLFTPAVWNPLPAYVRTCPSLFTFAASLRPTFPLFPPGLRRPPHNSPSQCFRFGHWLTLCTEKIYLLAYFFSKLTSTSSSIPQLAADLEVQLKCNHVIQIRCMANKNRKRKKTDEAPQENPDTTICMLICGLTIPLQLIADIYTLLLEITDGLSGWRLKLTITRDAFAAMTAHRPLSFAMCSNDDNDWPVHSLMLSLHDLCALVTWRLPSTVL